MASSRFSIRAVMAIPVLKLTESLDSSQMPSSLLDVPLLLSATQSRFSGARSTTTSRAEGIHLPQFDSRHVCFQR